MRWICWSFESLLAGVHPSRGPDGEAFEIGSRFHEKAGQTFKSGLRAVIWAIQGDQEYLSNVLKLPYWKADKMCWMCDADASDPDKTWRLINPELGAWEDYDRQHHVDHPPNHPIFGIAGVTTMNVTLDCLHVIFNNGIMAHFLASVLHIPRGLADKPSPHRLAWVSFGRRCKFITKSAR